MCSMFQPCPRRGLGVGVRLAVVQPEPQRQHPTMRARQHPQVGNLVGGLVRDAGLVFVEHVVAEHGRLMGQQFSFPWASR